VSCPQCRPEPPPVDVGALGLVHEGILVDESHLIISFRRCPACRQRFLSVFTERIDWVGGNDPQTWMLLALDDAEAEKLGADGDFASLRAAAMTRDALRIHHPASGPATAAYGCGPLIGWHD
jgi:hypothetical protein